MATKIQKCISGTTKTCQRRKVVALNEYAQNVCLRSQHTTEHTRNTQPTHKVHTVNTQRTHNEHTLHG
jgi:hypothetical protein